MNDATADGTRDAGSHDSGSPTYSVCLTHYNQGETLRTSLESILSLSPFESEVVVVDAGSDDGSLEVLRTFVERHDRLRCLVEPGCNRGEGRQSAVEAARGKHVLLNYDLDQQYDDILDDILRVYQDLLNSEGNVALRTAGNLFVAPRDLVLSIGGYAPLMRGEDHELTDRLEDCGVLRYLPVIATRNVAKKDRSMTERARRAFRSAKALYRIGFDPNQLARFLYAEHPFPLAVVGTPLYALGVLAGIAAGRVYDERRKHWREIFEMSARPTYPQIVVDVPKPLKSYEVPH